MDLKRIINMSIHSYDQTKLCDLYNSNTRTIGQAYDIYIEKDSSGWKELKFSIPYRIIENGETAVNHRVQYIKNEYLVSFTDNGQLDWYYISEPNIQHNEKTLTLQITCSHVSALLRMKNLYLELDGESGVGTCGSLAQQILDKTGWGIGRIDSFYEQDGITEKVRTLKVAEKTGAYQAIVSLCNLFNARPIFNGHNKTVDIVVYNPFSNQKGSPLPVVEDIEKIFELNYGKAMGGVSRKLSTESLITRLYVDGEYGDDGYVGIEQAEENTTGLGFLTNFSYFESIGLFTEDHQEILDDYISDISVQKQAIASKMAAILDKENKLNQAWGDCEYGCFNLSSQVTQRRINLSLIYTNAEETPVVKAGQKIIFLNEDGSYTSSEIESGTVNYVILKEDFENLSPNKKIIIFFNSSSGLIGGKEVALEAVQKTIADTIKDLKKAQPDHHTVFAQQSAPISGMVTDDIWVNTSVTPFTVHGYAQDGWTVAHSGKISRLSVVLVNARTRENNLINGTDEQKGLNTLMFEADALARLLKVLYDDYDLLIQNQNTIEQNFSTDMGDMLRDGHWSNQNYVQGQEDKLYADAKEVIGAMSYPEASYEISACDLYEQAVEDMHSGNGHEVLGDITASVIDGELIIDVPSSVVGVAFPYPVSDTGGILKSHQSGDGMKLVFSLSNGYLMVDSGTYAGKIQSVPSWQDIDIDFFVHIIDTEIGISEWGFVNKILKCYDQPWKTDIQTSTKKSDIISKSFADILASMNAIAEEVRGKSDVYDRSRLISSAKKLSADALQGIIDVNKNAMLSSMSNWGTDNNGNIVFTSLDGSAAMMLTGMGFMIANKKDTDGNWVWRSFGTGDGFSADEVNTGVLNAGAVQILGTDQFYWDADNIYIYDTDEPMNQIRIGRYDGTKYGVGFTNDGGGTWQTAIGFDGGHLGSINYSDYEEGVSGLQEDIADVNEQISGIEGFTNVIFQDGVVTRAEKESLKSHLRQLESEKSDLDQRYQSIYNDVNLIFSAKQSLQEQKANYNVAHQTLVHSINMAVYDSEITEAERQEVSAVFQIYKEKLQGLSEAFEAAVRRIENSKADVTTLNLRLIYITAEKAEIDAIYEAVYNNENTIGDYKTGLYNAKQLYDAAYAALSSAISTSWADFHISESERADLETKQADYTAKHAYLASALEESQASAIENRNKHFTSIPSGPYFIGDTWTQLSTGKTYICNTSREIGFDASNWTLLETVVASFTGKYQDMILKSGMKVGDIWLIQNDPNESMNGRTYYATGSTAGSSSWTLTSTRRFSGASVVWDAETGLVDIKAGKKVSIISGGELEFTGDNLVTIGTGGTLNMVGSDINMSAAGELKITGSSVEIEADSSLAIKGSTVSVDASSEINITGADVNITGTDVDIQGSSVDITASGELNVTGSSVNVTGGSNVKIEAPAQLVIKAGTGAGAVGMANGKKPDGTSNGGIFLHAGGENPATAPFRVTMAGDVVAMRIQQEHSQSYWDMADPDYPAEFPIYIPDGYTIDTVRFTFKSGKARTFAKGAKGGGGQTSSSGGGGEKTSRSGGGATVTSGQDDAGANTKGSAEFYTGYQGEESTKASSAANTGLGGAHSHSVAAISENAPTSDPGGHTHTGPSHLHTIESHTHTGPNHSHAGPSHLHTIESHTHTGPSHSHTGPEHVHTGNSHSHAWSDTSSGPSTNSTSSDGTHSHTITNHRHAYTMGASYTGYEQPGSVNAGSHTHTLYSHTHDVSGTTDAAGTGNTGAAGTGATGTAGTGATGGTALSTNNAGDGNTGTAGTGATGGTALGTNNAGTGATGGAGGHTHTFTVRAHDTGGAADHTHGMSHTHGLYLHTHLVGTHVHGLNQHTHSVTVGSHSHIVDIDAHTHTVEDHTHDLDFGINEKTALATSCVLKVNGTTIGTYSPSPGVPIEIKGHLTGGTWNTVTVHPNDDARISAFVLVRLTPIT